MAASRVNYERIEYLQQADSLNVFRIDAYGGPEGQVSTSIVLRAANTIANCVNQYKHHSQQLI
jgi:hypothetical protein